MKYVSQLTKCLFQESQKTCSCALDALCKDRVAMYAKITHLESGCRLAIRMFFSGQSRVGIDGMGEDVDVFLAKTLPFWFMFCEWWDAKNSPPKTSEKNAIIRPGFPFLGGWTNTGRPGGFSGWNPCSLRILVANTHLTVAHAENGFLIPNRVLITCNGFGRSSLVRCRKHFR